MTTFKTDVIIELHVPDFQKAYDYYKVLGFQIVWMEKTYLVMRRGDSVICFYGGSPQVADHPYFGAYPNDTKRGYGVELILFVDDVAGYYDRIKSNVKVVEALKRQPWGRSDFRIEDPFGFYLRISEAYDTVNNQQQIARTLQSIDAMGFRL